MFVRRYQTTNLRDCVVKELQLAELRHAGHQVLQQVWGACGAPLLLLAPAAGTAA
jgi:hypothetical protein